MTFTEAAAEVLRQVGRPLHYKEITAYAIEKSLLSHVGKSPEVTMGARLAALFKKPGDENPMVRVRPGVFALKTWEESGQLKEMVAKTKPTARTVTAPEAVPEPVAPEVEAAPEPEPEPAKVEEPVEPPPESSPRRPIRRRGRIVEAKPDPVAGEPSQAVEPPSAPQPPPTEPAEAAPADEPAVPDSTPPPQDVEEDLDEEVSGEVLAQADQAPEADDETPDNEEVERSELAARASDVFEEEDDDDQPILQNQEADRDGSRRRRRRRRRPKGSESNGIAYSATPMGPGDGARADGAVAEPRPMPATTSGPHPVVLEVGSSSLDHVAMDDFGGKDMADAIALALAAADRASGPVSLRQLAETAQRRGRLAGDLQQLQSQIAASVRADNLRRVAAGQRPRFRFVAGRVALTDWLLNSDLARLEQEAIASVERYREAARKAFVRKLQELPGHAFVELTLLVFERLGFRHVRAVRRAGIPGQESHFTAVHDTGAGQLQSALIIRRDGREIGRERVAELRGAFHHYGPASVGWLVTAGPVLSGAREEAAAPNAAAVVLYDGFGIARLCEQHDVAVVRATLPICIPDLDVLEALRSS
jgi:restriction endonuclease Mrr